MKKTIILCLVLLLLLTGCAKASTRNASRAEMPVIVESSEKSAEESSEETATNEVPTESQETPAVSGETIAVITVTDFGEIRVKFFPESAPKAVENFVTLSSQGYYDGVTFHRVMYDFMIQGGDPTGLGNGGKSIWNKTFEDEFSDLVPIRGALCMANAGPNTNGSQFFIVQTSDPFEAYLDQFGLNDDQKELFKKYGGTPWLYQAHTVFGQVVEGMDVVDAIAAVSTNSNDKPLKDVVIEHIEITTAE